MNPRKGLVLDANILLRAVLGIRVRRILEAYEDVAAFYCPDVCFAEAEKYIPDLARRRGLDLRLALSVLEQVSRIVDLVDKFSASLNSISCSRNSTILSAPWSSSISPRVSAAASCSLYGGVTCSGKIERSSCAEGS